MTGRSMALPSSVVLIPRIYLAVRIIEYLTRKEAGRSLKLGRNEHPITCETTRLSEHQVPHVFEYSNAYRGAMFGFLSGVDRIGSGFELLDHVLPRGDNVLLETTVSEFAKQEIPHFACWEIYLANVFMDSRTPKDIVQRTLLSLGWFLRDRVHQPFQDIAADVTREVISAMEDGRVKLAPQAALQYLASEPKARAMELAFQCGRRVCRYGFSWKDWIVRHDGLGNLRDQLYLDRPDEIPIDDLRMERGGFVLQSWINTWFYPPAELQYVSLTLADDPVIHEESEQGGA